MALQRNDEPLIDDILGENETLVYSRENTTILNITLKEIYFGSEGELVTFEPVFQYVDPEFPLDQSPDNGTVIPDNPQNNSTNTENPGSMPGFGITGTTLSLLAGIYLLRSRIKA
ncbi:hypothetical protein J2755_000061 [Methanohalophilus levihalophilus]|nr:hypothetical protein [Methanohalophilus levihalophilus]